ncbi:eukaryotic rRNA processing [Pavlovales sp. CCMP2436]|nr:eukaryotic rRNA processing [Pavlovales sp. CCMP2436]
MDAPRELEDEVRAKRPYKDVNNTAALTQKLDEMLADNQYTEFRDTLCIVTDRPIELGDVDDDLKRELAFYNNALQAVHLAQAKLDELGIPHKRPDDYFAEMVKSDSHMARVKTRLIKQQTDAKEAEERRKSRDSKKFGKQFQAAKTQERALKSKASKDAAKGLKRGRPSSLDDDEGGGGGFGAKRSPGGAGGEKRFKGGDREAKEAKWKRPHKDKHNSAESIDAGKFNAGKWNVAGANKGGSAGKGGKGGSPKQRPGKERRQHSKGK